jgi:ABC-type Fe3+-hydroxamate transport system substrate-binding protein
VAALGCSDALVARTDYCVEPTLDNVPTIGGTKNPRLDDICDLSPDLVIANQEENTKSDLEKLAQRGVRVYVSFPRRVAEGIAHLSRLARIFHVERDPKIRALCKEGYEMLHETPKSVRAFCPIWLDPLMTIHGETFISDMMELAGFENVFSDRKRRYPLAADLGDAPEKPAGDRDTRYPRVTFEEVASRSPEIVLLPDEPYAFTSDHQKLFSVRSELVSGKDLSWYGAWSMKGLPRLRFMK